jgi:hypothetical protein
MYVQRLLLLGMEEYDVTSKCDPISIKNNLPNPLLKIPKYYETYFKGAAM